MAMNWELDWRKCLATTTGSFFMQNLQQLDLSYISFLGPDLLCRLVRNLPHVKSLNLQMTPVTDQVKKKSFQKCLYSVTNQQGDLIVCPAAEIL